jgi:hypothetical protein
MSTVEVDEPVKRRQIMGFYATPELEAATRRAAKQEMVSKSDIVRRALLTELRRLNALAE